VRHPISDQAGERGRSSTGVSLPLAAAGTLSIQIRSSIRAQAARADGRRRRVPKSAYHARGSAWCDKGDNERAASDETEAKRLMR
jgi:hypothetical protein